MKLKIVIQVVLLIGIVILGYMLWESIQKPIRFNKVKAVKELATINRLKDIRTAQLAYKSEYDQFTGDFDSLITFLKEGSFSVVQAIGSVPDSLIELLGRKKAETQALKSGLISRDTIKVPVMDSLFYKGYPVDSLKYIPYGRGQKFEMGAGLIETGSHVKVRVFEAKVPFDILLKGLDRQLVINYKEEREKITGYPGIKVGSLVEATNNAGNWE